MIGDGVRDTLDPRMSSGRSGNVKSTAYADRP